MTSTVMTGRRTKSSDRFTVENLRLDLDLRPGSEAQLALGDHPFAFFQTVRDDRAVAFGSLMVTLRNSMVISGLTTKTYWPLGPVCTDLDGTIKASFWS